MEYKNWNSWKRRIKNSSIDWVTPDRSPWTSRGAFHELCSIHRDWEPLLSSRRWSVQNTRSLKLSFLLSPSSAPSDMSTKKVPSLIYWSPSPWSLSVYLVLYKDMFIDSWPYIVGWDVGLVHRVVGVHLASSCHEDMETGSYSWQHRGQLPEAPHGLARARSNWHEVPIEPVGLSCDSGQGRVRVQRQCNTAPWTRRCRGVEGWWMTSTLLTWTILWSSIEIM